MKVQTVWNEKTNFTSQADRFYIPMDTKQPLGSDSAPTPKQFLLSAICGCTGMDVVGLLKKHKQPLQALTITAEGILAEGGHPHIFKEVRLDFQLSGELDAPIVTESVRLSQTKYCSVSAMISKAVPINYTIHLNSVRIGSGSANFS